MTYNNFNAPRATAAHRQRLMDGMIQCLEKQGYEGTTIADIASAAHVSKRTFYEHFASKQDCLVALYRQGLNEALDRMRKAAEATPSSGDRVEAALRALLEHFSINAVRSKAVLLGVMGLGELGLKLRQQGQRELILVLADHAGIETQSLPPLFMEGMMGIVSEWTFSAFLSGHTEDLPDRAAQAALLIRAGLETVQSAEWSAPKPHSSMEKASPASPSGTNEPIPHIAGSPN